MSNQYHSNCTGESYFFTLTSYQHQTLFCNTLFRIALHNAILETGYKHPFVMNASVILPDHLHCIWTLPANDSNHRKRWALIKRKVSQYCVPIYKQLKSNVPNIPIQSEFVLWERGYRQQQICNQQDFQKYLDYIHRNPVKHKLVHQTRDWPYSTFRRYVKQGMYPLDWGSEPNGKQQEEK